MPAQHVRELGTVDGDLPMVSEVVFAKGTAEGGGFSPDATGSPNAVGNIIVCGVCWPRLYRWRRQRAVQEFSLCYLDGISKPNTPFPSKEVEQIAAFPPFVVVPAAPLGAGDAQREGAAAAPPHLAPGLGGGLAQQRAPDDVGLISQGAGDVSRFRLVMWGVR
jgi:hypothetical protein